MENISYNSQLFTKSGGKIPTTFTNTEVNNCFRIKHTDTKSINSFLSIYRSFNLSFNDYLAVVYMFYNSKNTDKTHKVALKSDARNLSWSKYPTVIF